MKKIIVATALALSLGTSVPALAASHGGMMKTYEAEQKGDFYAADFIGKEIYTSEMEWDENFIAQDGWENEWDNIGQVENVILNQDGTVKAVILEVGGFLDIGDKHIAVPMDQLSFIQNGDSWDNYFLAVKTSAEQLESMPAYKEMTDEERQANADTIKQDGENQTAENEQMNAETDNTETASTERRMDNDGRMMMTPPTLEEREGYQSVERGEMTADRLTGARVYGANDEDVGEVSDLVLSSDGTTIERFVIDVGGFLGIGEHTIALTADEVRIIRDAEWGDVRIYVDSTEEALEEQPAYRG